MSILHLINFLFSWALLIVAILVNISLLIDRGGDTRIVLWELLSGIAINIAVVRFTYHTLSSGHGYFDITSCYFYGFMLLLNAVILGGKDRTNILTAIPVLLPFITFTGGALILISLKLISFVSKIVGFTIGLTFKLFGFVFSITYIVIGILLFLYLIILYNVIFRPNSKLASYNDKIKYFIWGIFFPEKVAPKYIINYLDNSGYQSTQSIHAMLKRKRIKLSDETLQEILFALENDGIIYQSAVDGWEIAKKDG